MANIQSLGNSSKKYILHAHDTSGCWYKCCTSKIGFNLYLPTIITPHLPQFTLFEKMKAHRAFAGSLGHVAAAARQRPDHVFEPLFLGRPPVCVLDSPYAVRSLAEAQRDRKAV
jgi:hypothetical protein